MVTQLYGSTVRLALETIEEDSYSFYTNFLLGKIKMHTITTTILSKEAKEFADKLYVDYTENIVMK